MITKFRWFLARLLIGKTPVVANVEYKGIVFGENLGMHVYGNRLIP